MLVQCNDNWYKMNNSCIHCKNAGALLCEDGNAKTRIFCGETCQSAFYTSIGGPITFVLPDGKTFAEDGDLWKKYSKTIENLLADSLDEVNLNVNAKVAEMLITIVRVIDNTGGTLPPYEGPGDNAKDVENFHVYSNGPEGYREIEIMKIYHSKNLDLLETFINLFKLAVYLDIEMVSTHVSNRIFSIFTNLSITAPKKTTMLLNQLSTDEKAMVLANAKTLEDAYRYSQANPKIFTGIQHNSTFKGVMLKKYRKELEPMVYKQWKKDLIN